MSPLALQSDAIVALTLTPGTRLGPYEILSALGADGMGEVYKARNTRLDRIVAIKKSHASLISAILKDDPPCGMPLQQRKTEVSGPDSRVYRSPLSDVVL